MMSAITSSIGRREFVASAGAVGVSALFATSTRAAVELRSIRPFRIAIPEQQLADLRRRLLATRWPERETVTDRSQGVQLAKIEEIVRYWRKDYDWRNVEARLNALPQFMTEIDGLDIHFILVRSEQENALPLAARQSGPGSRAGDTRLLCMGLFSIFWPGGAPCRPCGSLPDEDRRMARQAQRRVAVGH